jgi:hypothetical protein
VSKLKRGPLTTDELDAAKVKWVQKVQTNLNPDLQMPGWEVVQEDSSGLLKCKGQIPGYQPIYLDGGEFTREIDYAYPPEDCHFGVANTMVEIRENWWIPRLRSKVKKVIDDCNVCKIYRVRPYSPTVTAELPDFRVQSS